MNLELICQTTKHKTKAFLPNSLNNNNKDNKVTNWMQNTWKENTKVILDFEPENYLIKCTKHIVKELFGFGKTYNKMKH
jgi:hypothetical protein